MQEVLEEKISYPWTRHYQRYEYLIHKGYLTNRKVIDLGCGFPLGVFVLMCVAKYVMGIDWALKDRKYFLNAPKPIPGNQFNINNLKLIIGDLFSVDEHFDIALAIELIEHMKYPDVFIDKISSICDYAFFTTPLADKTRKTSNEHHFREYSKEDFRNILSRRFEIIDTKYQTSDLKIIDNAEAQGDSVNINHIVQMAWCRRL